MAAWTKISKDAVARGMLVSDGVVPALCRLLGLRDSDTFLTRFGIRQDAGE